MMLHLALACCSSLVLPPSAPAPLQDAPATVAPAAVAVDAPPALPGSAWSQPPAGTVLRAGPSGDHTGVLTLDGETVVRLGEARGAFREVFVPQGFAVYMHEDYLALKPSEATVTVTGHRVNVRLLPTTDGLAPITQISRDAGTLVLLERTGAGWARLLAPPSVPLYAAAGDIAASAPADAAAQWERGLARREAQRAAALEAWRARDPGWRAEMDLLARAERLAETDVTALDAGGLAQRRLQLDDIATSASWAQTLELAGKLRADIAQVESLRAQAARALDQVQRDQAQDEALLRREARMLGLGLRFLGRGERVSRLGSVHKAGLADAPIYTLHGADGEILKLTASSEVATLEALVGRRVELDGRRLNLLNVVGPVLVIDKLVSSSR